MEYELVVGFKKLKWKFIDAGDFKHLKLGKIYYEDSTFQRFKNMLSKRVE